MAFRYDRLTGARRRKWLRAEAYAPNLTPAEVGRIPKTIRELIKKTNRLKACVRVGGEGDVHHYLVVVGHRVGFVHHACLKTDLSRAKLAGIGDIGCRCSTVFGRYVTWPRLARGDRNKDLAWTDETGGLNEKLIAVREACRPPAGRFRYRHVRTSYRHDKRNEFRDMCDETRHPVPVAYPRRVLTRMGLSGTDARIQKMVESHLVGEIARRTGADRANLAVGWSSTYRSSALKVGECGLVYLEDATVSAGRPAVKLTLDPNVVDWLTYFARVMCNPRPDHEAFLRVSEFPFGNVTICVGVSLRALTMLVDPATHIATSAPKPSRHLAPHYWVAGGAVIKTRMDPTDSTVSDHLVGVNRHLNVRNKLTFLDTGQR